MEPLSLILGGIVFGAWRALKSDSGSCSSCGDSGRNWDGTGYSPCYCPRGDDMRRYDEQKYKGY